MSRPKDQISFTVKFSELDTVAAMFPEGQMIYAASGKDNIQMPLPNAVNLLKRLANLEKKFSISNIEDRKLYFNPAIGTVFEQNAIIVVDYYPRGFTGKVMQVTWFDAKPKQGMRRIHVTNSYLAGWCAPVPGTYNFNHWCTQFVAQLLHVVANEDGEAIVEGLYCNGNNFDPYNEETRKHDLKPEVLEKFIADYGHLLTYQLSSAQDALKGLYKEAEKRKSLAEKLTQTAAVA